MKAPPTVVALTGIAAAREYASFFHDPVGCMRRLSRERGPLIALSRVPTASKHGRVNVIAVGPEYNRLVLGNAEVFRTTGQMIRGPDDSAQRRLRLGLTRMNGPQHKQQRALIMPPFHKKAVQGYHDSMVATASAVLAVVQPGGVHDVYRLMRKLTLEISSTILFSPDPVEAHEIGTMLERWLGRNFSAPVWLVPFNLPGTPYRALLRHAERMEKKILDMIAKRRANPEGRLDVLSLLIQARDEESHGMSDAELVGQSTILFGASFETTATTLTWTLLLLAQHPAVMHQVMDELDAVLAGSPPEFGQLGQLSQLELLDRVIKESMRILPPVPFTIRAATTRTWLGPLRIGNGSRAICSHYLTHHLPELYPEPERFRPERWTTIQPNQYEYLPFSAGPRACIGAMFAIQAMKITLVMLLQRFRFQVVPGTRIDRVVRITMTPRYGMPMTLHPIDRQFAASKVRGQIHEMVTFPQASGNN